MLATLIAQAGDPNPWEFRWHPEVWALVAFLVGAYIYMVRVIGPGAVAPGTPVVTRANKISFVAAMAMLWIASDYPVHDIGEQYLYSVHMLQHMMLSYFLPPLALMATPTWLMRVLIGDGRLYGAVRWLCRPVTAGVAFNLVAMLTHVPLLVNESLDNGPLHYTLHFLVVAFSLLMWMPVVGPIPEFHIGPLPKCIYLFLQSVVPTVPAAWLTFAEGAVYSAYDVEPRLWLSVTSDQQLAGAIMKTGGGIFLWSIVVYLFFKRFAVGYGDKQDYRRRHRIPTAEITGNDEQVLTTDDVERAFAASVPPASEPGEQARRADG